MNETFLKELRRGHELVYNAMTLLMVAERTIDAQGADPAAALRTVRENIGEIDRWLNDQEERVWRAMADGRTNGRRSRSRKAATT